MPVSLRADFDASQLRSFARKSKDGPQARRLLALVATRENLREIVIKAGGHECCSSSLQSVKRMNLPSSE
jgi:hypothetical protein